MKLYVILVLFVTGLFFSCDTQTTTDDLNDQQTLLVTDQLVNSIFVKSKASEDATHQKSENATRVEKIFKVRTTGTINEMTCDFDENLGKRVVEGTGQATHLGRFSLNLSYCFNEFGPVEYIYATQTAANGDEVHSVVVGANPAQQSLDFAIIGGTGRFDGATGKITLFFEYPSPDTFSNYGEGTLVY